MQVSTKEVNGLIAALTATFLLVAAFLLSYISLYNRRKRKHFEEKERMRLSFAADIAQTQLEVQEQTLQTIGAELHDNVGQLLSLTSLTLNSIELAGNPKVQKKIDESIELTLRSISEMRQLGHIMQGDKLVAAGLAEAIGQLVSWMERTGKYKVVYTTADDLPPGANADKDLIIFRITQEIFNNIIKHAAASRISISLEYAEGVLHLRVADNGMGFPTADGTAPPSQGMGLQNIHHRAGIIGGTASISSKPGEGTQIIVSIPYP